MAWVCDKMMGVVVHLGANGGCGHNRKNWVQKSFYYDILLRLDESQKAVQQTLLENMLIICQNSPTVARVS